MLVCSGEHSCRAALAYIELYGAGFDAKTAAYKILKIFTAASKHLVTEGVGSGSAVVFADESAVFIMDSLRYTDYDVAVFLEGSMNFLEKFFYIEIGFRKINEKRIVSNIFPGKGSSSGEPACVTSHDLDDSDGFFLIDTGVQGDLTDGGSYVAGSTSESGSMVGVYKIVINGLRLTEDTDVAADLFSIAGKLADGIHGIVAADIKEPADIHLLEFLKKLRINRILQGFRKLVTAGAEIGAGCPGKSEKLLSRKCFLEIKDCSV